MSVGQWRNDTDRRNRSTWRKFCPNATLSTTNPTQTGLGSKPGFRGEIPATDRLSHGTTCCIIQTFLYFTWDCSSAVVEDIRCEAGLLGKGLQTCCFHILGQTPFSGLTDHEDEDEGTTILENVKNYLPNNRASYPKIYIYVLSNFQIYNNISLNSYHNEKFLI